MPADLLSSTIGAFDPSTGNWYLSNNNSSSGSNIGPFAYGASGWYPVVGDWNGDGETTIGAVDTSGTNPIAPGQDVWYLRNGNSPGGTSYTPFGYGPAGSIPVAGDWTGTGHTGIGVFDSSTGQWYLRTEVGPGRADAGTFAYGGAGWMPVVGDWTGQGKDTIGVVDPTANGDIWYLKNSNSPGAPSFTPFSYGAGGWTPVAGDWTGVGHSGIGVFNPATATFYLRNEVGPGAADASVFQYGGASWKPVVGDWTGQGKDTIGVFDPSTGDWYLSNSNSSGGPNIVPFSYGAGMYPIVGDWNGDGLTTIGVVDTSGTNPIAPGQDVWYLSNNNSPGGTSYASFGYGPAGSIPVAGDWTGTGHAGIGVFEPSTGEWFLRTEVGPGGPDAGTFAYGGAGWMPVVGDWTGQGKDTIGVVDPTANGDIWYLKNSNGPGAPSFTPFSYGADGTTPVAGNWTGVGHSGIGVFDSNGNWWLRTEVGPGSPDAGHFGYGLGTYKPVVGHWDFPTLPQLAAGGEALVPSHAPTLTQRGLQSEVRVALSLLASDGVNAALLAKFGSLQFTVGQLPAGYLALSDVATGTVEISADAAGYGWFEDANPLLDQAFINGVAQPGSAAANRMDLLTVVLHEMGHFNGWTELNPATNPDALMDLTLGIGERRTQDIDAVFAAGL